MLLVSPKMSMMINHQRPILRNTSQAFAHFWFEIIRRNSNTTPQDPNILNWVFQRWHFSPSRYRRSNYAAESELSQRVGHEKRVLTLHSWLISIVNLTSVGRPRKVPDHNRCVCQRLDFVRNLTIRILVTLREKSWNWFMQIISTTWLHHDIKIRHCVNQVMPWC